MAAIQTYYFRMQGYWFSSISCCWHYTFDLSFSTLNLLFIMKKTLGFLLLAFMLNDAFAQSNDALQFTISQSTHGTGDLKGFSFDLSYDHSLKRRFDWTNGLTTTIHSGHDRGEYTIFFPNQPPIVVNPDSKSFLHYTTAGVQLTSILNFNILAFPRHKLRIGVGPIFRYESSSYPESWSYTLEATDEAVPVYTFNYQGDTNQFNIGYSFGLSYFAAITKKYQLGIKVFFQNDTDGASITHLGLSIGRFLQLSKMN